MQQASSREWLETNGLGSFASSTITGLNTRRYHGLLVAATSPPVGRMVLLSKLEEVLIIGDQRFELSTNQYPGTIHPNGYKFLKGFRLDRYPIFTFEIDDVRVEKHVCMMHGEDSVVVQYRLLDGPTKSVHLEVRPLIAFRDYHSLTHKNEALNREIVTSPGCVSISPYEGLPALHIAHNATLMTGPGDWYFSFQYIRERERGLDFEEDLFSPFCLRAELSAAQKVNLIASTQVRDASQADLFIKSEAERRRAISTSTSMAGQLARAADQFIVRRGAHKTVIAGYHWFGDWGRDTMISLRGLALSTGRADDARDVLIEFSKNIDQGMLPNRFPESGENPEYNTVDATLWYFEAIRSYHTETGDDALVKRLMPLLAEIVDWHVKGTRFGIHVDTDGLLHAGPQLTWMDAKVGEWCVTPRDGKAVEIQALWYNALRTQEHFAERFGDDAEKERCGQLAVRTRESFNLKFWNERDYCLFDVVSEPNDASVRPNQIFAVSLHYCMLERERSSAVVEKVQRELLTPYGLRTLSPADPKYIGHYGGDQRSRDSAYHQGTVWPWLLGPFIEAYIKLNGGVNASVKTQIAQWLSQMKIHLTEAGLGSVSEIFEGDPPHAPCGCIAQAWSVGELLRLLRLAELDI